jgi:putative transposase
MNNWNSIITAAAHGLTAKGLEYAVGVATNPPSRNPSNASGANLIVDFVSRKMECTMPVESLTVEAAYAQMLEIKLPCMGYWTQPLKLPILCTCRDGIKRTLWLTFDFMVVYASHVELVECKTEAEAVKLSLEWPGRYQRDENGNWRAPEIEEALKEYGIKFRIVTTAELPSKALRNYTLLEEARQTEYSAPAALDRIIECFAKNDQGVPLADLIGKAGPHFTKNDVYFAIRRNDLHVLIDECLLVDDRTTLVFAEAHHADVYRLLNFQTKPRHSAPVILKQGSRLRWNQTDYTICSASPGKVYVVSKDGAPICMPQPLLQSLLREGEIVLLDEESISLGVLKKDLERYLKVLTHENQTIAINRKRFLDFKKENPAARPEDFGLEPVAPRTIQRWAWLYRTSVSKYGNPYWLLLEQPRSGQPREDFPKEMRDEMSAIANELYFRQTKPSLRSVWRALRERRMARKAAIPSIGAFRDHVAGMKNMKGATTSRDGTKAAYKFGSSDLGEPNWITPGDFPFKITQMDGKTLDIELVDEETGEILGKPTLTLRVLPHYGSAPVGWSFLFEPESYRSATMAYRDQMERFGQPSKYEIVDNGKAFNNTTYDQLLATLETTKINRKPYDPRYASEIEAIFRVLDREVIHNLAGNTKATMDVQNMSPEMDPKKRAVWTFSALYEHLEYYLFTLLWDAPSASLGTTPRIAFERDMKRAPSREGRLLLPPDQIKIAYFPEVDGCTRLVQPGRGVYVEGYYYWNKLMEEAKVERTKVAVRYDPFDLYTVYAAIDGKWVECEARHAPELRNVTEKTRRMMTIARRSLNNSHAKRRENTHGHKLAELDEDARKQEKLLRQKRRAKAQRPAGKANEQEPANVPVPTDGIMPEMDFSHFKKSA